MNYDIKEEPTSKAEEPVAYSAQVNATEQQNAETLRMEDILKEASVEEKIAYLRANLSPDAVAYLEFVGWMIDKPFPYDSKEDDDSWIDEAEAAGDTDIVPNEIVMHDREVWRNLR